MSFLVAESARKDVFVFKNIGVLLPRIGERTLFLFYGWWLI